MSRPSLVAAMTLLGACAGDPPTLPSAGDTSDTGAADTGATTSAPSTSSSVEPSSDSSGASETTAAPAVCGNGQREDGEDCDDANAIELDGCTSSCELGPTGLQLGARLETTDTAGGTTQDVAPAQAECPAGMILVGMYGNLVADGMGAVLIGQLGGRCAPPTLVEGPPIAIELGPTTDLPLDGSGNNAGPWSLDCPLGAAVDGFSGNASLAMDALSLQCSPPQIEEAADGGLVVTWDPPSMIGPAGGDRGAPFGVVECKGDKVATGYELEYAGRIVRLALQCRPLEIVY